MPMLTRARRRSTALATTLLVTGALAVPLASPAQALTVPEWRTGHVPSGADCRPTTVTNGAPARISYSDTGAPEAVGWTLNDATDYAVLVPGAQTLTFAARLVENCTGVSRAELVVTYRNLKDGAGYYVPSATVPLTTDPFDQRMAWRLPSVGPEYAGEYRMPSIAGVRRYDSITVTLADYAFYSSTPGTSFGAYATGSWSSQKTFLLLRTTVAASASATKVKKGKKIKVGATLKKAGAASYIPAVGSKIALQTRIGTKAWVTRAVLTVPASGSVSYSFAPKKTSTWRWVHAGERSTLFTAPVTSAAKKVTVR
jgi:hypothetical protein